MPTCRSQEQVKYAFVFCHWFAKIIQQAQLVSKMLWFIYQKWSCYRPTCMAMLQDTTTQDFYEAFMQNWMNV